MYKKQNLLVLLSIFLSMSFVGLVLNLYLDFEKTNSITIDIFNKNLIKSTVISLIILIIFILFNKKNIQ